MNDEGHAAACVGGLFLPVDGSKTFKLSEIKVVPTEEETFMDPETEFIQLLDPDTTEVSECLCCVTPEFVKGCFDPVKEKDDYDYWMSLVGWWLYENIGEEDAERDDMDVDVGQAFLGYLNGSALNFMSSGEVPQKSTALNDGGHAAPYFFNYLLTTKPISAFTISPTEEETFMDPETEFLQILDPDTTDVDTLITYVSPEFVNGVFDPVKEKEDYDYWMSLVGWWVFEAIDDEPYEEDVLPGAAFLGSLNGSGLDLNLPSAL